MSKSNNTKVNTAAATAAPVGKVDGREVAKITAILTAICIVITALLAATNQLTLSKIAENSRKAKETAWSEVLPAEEYIAVSQCDVRFADYDAAIAISGGRLIGLVVTTEDRGYGGELSVLTGFDSEGSITGVKLLSHSETPGLGANASKPKFLDQFITPAEESRRDSYEVVKDGGTIDAVTAATMSSRAVTRAVNKAINIYIELNSAGVLRLPEDYSYTAPSGSDAANGAVSGSDMEDRSAALSNSDNNGENVVSSTTPTVLAKEGD